MGLQKNIKGEIIPCLHKEKDVYGEDKDHLQEGEEKDK